MTESASSVTYSSPAVSDTSLSPSGTFDRRLSLTTPKTKADSVAFAGVGVAKRHGQPWMKFGAQVPRATTFAQRGRYFLTYRSVSFVSEVTNDRTTTSWFCSSETV